MNFLKKLEEQRLMFLVKKLRNEGGGPIVIKLHKSVLYQEEALCVLQYYVNLLSDNPPHHLCEGASDRKSNPLRLVSDKNSSVSNYWLYSLDGLYFAVLISQKSKLFIGSTVYVPYDELSYTCLGIRLKDCGRDFLMPARLLGRFVYSADGLKPVALIFECEGINSKIASILATKAEFNAKNRYFAGYDEYGIKHTWYNVCFSPLHSRPIYRQEKDKQLPIDSYERWWMCEKIVHQFGESERPSWQDMLTIWKIFLENS